MEGRWKWKGLIYRRALNEKCGRSRFVSFCFLVLGEKKGRPVLCECDIDITKSFKEATKDSGMFLGCLCYLCMSLKLQRDKKRNEKPAAT